MLKPDIWKGVDNLLDDYIGVKQRDTVILLYTSDSQESAVWVSAALELRQIEVKRLWMLPLVDESFKQRLLTILPESLAENQRLIILSFERDTMSHTYSLAELLAGYPVAQLAVYRTISACPELFTQALMLTPEELTARNTALLERLMDASRLRITTAGGTDITVKLDKKYRWISNRGVAKTGGVVILPAGEVATYPDSVNGIFVADFAFNVNAITREDARLASNAVTVWLENSRVVKYECQNPRYQNFLRDCFHTYCAFSVGELGFGTNAGIDEPLAMNSHLNERRPGVHIGFGQHNQAPEVVEYQCKIHLDLIARGALVWIDDELEPVDLERLVPSANPHPLEPRDEDVFAPDFGNFSTDDCCGLVTERGLTLCQIKES